MLGVLRIHEVHMQKKNSTAFKFEETSFKREGKTSLSKTLKVHMREFDGLDNSNRSTNDDVALMYRKFK